MASFFQNSISRRSFLKLMASAGAAAALPPFLPRSARAGIGQVLLVSDIHFNPFADVGLVPSLIASPASQWDAIFASSANTRLNCYGQETNYNLLNYGLQAMRTACPQPDCVIFTGDLPCHGIWDKFARFSTSLEQRDQFIAKLVEFMGLRFRAAFPGAPVYFTLGNNDSLCADYKVTPRGSYLHATAPLFSCLYLKEPQPSAQFMGNYQNLGCYNLPGPHAGLRVASINSNYLSRHWSCECCPGAPGDPATEQLDWLEAQLSAAAASSQAVWFLMHIPPGVNAYNTVQLVGPDGKLHSAVMDLKEEHNARLLAIMRKYAGVLRTGFCGHTHMDHFRAIGQGGRSLAMQRVTPALNSLFGGNPAFQVMSYSQADFGLRDLVTYYLDLASTLDLPGPGEGDDGSTPIYPYWRWEYAFNAAYGTESLSHGALWSLSQTMAVDEGLREKFRLFYNASRANAPGFSQVQSKAYWCALAHLEPNDYIQTYNSTVLSRPIRPVSSRAA